MFSRPEIEIIDVILVHFLEMDFGEFEGSAVGERRRDAEGAARRPTPRVPRVTTRLLAESKNETKSFDWTPEPEQR